MVQIDEAKLNGLRTASKLFDEKYGKEGTPTREEFNRQSSYCLNEAYLDNGDRQQISEKKLRNGRYFQ